MYYTTFSELWPYAVCTLRSFQIDVALQIAVATLTLARNPGEDQTTSGAVIARGLLGVHYISRDPPRFDGENSCDVLELHDKSKVGWRLEGEGTYVGLAGHLDRYFMRRPDEFGEDDAPLMGPVRYLYLESDAVRAELACRSVAVTLSHAEP